jgi:hypothetical protein
MVWHLQRIDRDRALERAQAEGRARLPDAGDAVEHFAQEALVMVGAADHDLDQVIVFAGDEIGLDHLRNPRQRLAEMVEDLVVMLVERDLDEDDIAEAQRLLVEHRDVFLDRAAFLQPLHPRPAGRGREPDLLGQRLDGQAAVLLQGGENPQIGGVRFIAPAVT